MFTIHSLTHGAICSISLNEMLSYKYTGTIRNISSIMLPSVLFSLQLIKCNQKCTHTSTKGIYPLTSNVTLCSNFTANHRSITMAESSSMRLRFV